MPKVRYTYTEAGNPLFSEEDILPPGMDIELRGKQMVMLWNERAQESGEPERELKSVEIVDAFVHEHVWQVTIPFKQTGRVDYVACQHCKAEGQRKPGGHVIRDKPYDGNGYEYCHEKKPQLRKPTFK